MLADIYRNLLAQETGTVYKSPGGRIRVALVYPNTYRVGMSNLGFQAIYYLLNQRQDTVCERAFLPEPEAEKILRRTRTPLPSLESRTPLADFDIVAFSVSFEGDYPNIIKILNLAHIPPLSSQRERPLVILGGICPTANPEPLAGIADVCILGEGEEVTGEVMDVYAQAWGQRAGREELLRGLSRITGVYVPEFWKPHYRDDGVLAAMESLMPGQMQPRRRWIKDLNKWPTVSRILTPQTEFDMYLVELSRGCLHQCRFCLVSRLYRPCRFRSLEVVREAVDQGLAQQKTIGLVGAAVSDYPFIAELSRYIVQKGGKFSVASLRADSLSGELLEGLAQSGHKTLALAPEAGSERLRKFIDKGLSEEQILTGVESILRHRIPNIRLYFMVGLPTEENEDIEAIVKLAQKAQAVMRQVNPAGRLSLSLSCFVPKPYTPLEWMEPDKPGSLKAKLNYIRRQLAGRVKVLADSPKSALLQAAFSTGNRNVNTLRKTF